jgi:rhodanese-related sulfurtransferase
MPGCNATSSRRHGAHGYIPAFIVLALVTPLLPSAQAESSRAADIFEATLQEPNQKTLELSYQELRQVLAQQSAVVLDARPYREYAMGHIPGALNVAAKPGVPIAQYVSDVAEIGRLLNNDKTAALVLYCNGPFCGKSKRLSAELIEAGYANVRRYQLGIPVWRALGGVTQIELEALLLVFDGDHTAVFIDARDREQYQSQTLPGARNLSRSGVIPGKDVGEVEKAKNDGRLPMHDHNTRVIVFGKDAAEAQVVAEALVHEAFHNVAFYSGTFDSLIPRIANK